MGSRRGARVAAGVLVLVLAAGCGSGSSDVRFVDRRPEVSPVRSVSVWSRADLKPIAQPVVVGGVAVGYVLAGRDLFLLGLDPESGKTLWKKPAGPGESGADYRFEPTVVGGRVVYLRPDRRGGLAARLIVADPRTGADIAGTGLALFGVPEACPDGRDVCVWSRPNEREGSRLHRLRLGTGAYGVEPPPARLPATASSLGEGLYDLGQEPETIGMVREDRLVWKLPVQDAFPAGFSTDNGSLWTHYAKAGVYAGSVYGGGGSRPGGPAFPIATVHATVGVSDRDGTVLWRDPGSRVDCNETLTGVTDRGMPKLAVRCRYEGSARWRPGGIVRVYGLMITVEGYDVRTGKATWSLRLGKAYELAGGHHRPARLGGTQVLVHSGKDGEHPVVVNLATGSRRPPVPGAVFWCSTMFEFTYHYPVDDPDAPGGKDHQRRGGDLFNPCNTAGKLSTSVPSGALTAASGVHAKNIAVLATTTGYRAYTTR